MMATWLTISRQVVNHQSLYEMVGGKIIFKRTGNIFWPLDGGSFFVHCLIFEAQHRNILFFAKQIHHSLSFKTTEYFHFFKRSEHHDMCLLIRLVVS
jgi:hypothetical protein